MLKKLKRAFTITELVIVIAVIAILAAVLIPTFSNVISSANKSAALQTATNAYKDYSAAAAEENKTELTGTVFVSDGYAYVVLNSSLQYIGKTSDLVNVSADGAFSSTTIKNFTTSVLSTTIKYTTITLSFTGKSFTSKDDEGKETTTKIADLDDVILTVSDLKESVTDVGKKAAETIYFYSVEVNGTTYLGYFTLEGEDALYQTQGATYSHAYGVVPSSSYEVGITATVPSSTEGSNG